MREIAKMMTRARKAARTADVRHGGFTFVELVIAMVIASIVLAGMVGIVTMVFGNFNAHKNLEAVTDSSRRALETITRELASTLKIVNDGTTKTSIEFWADVDGDNPTATVDASSLAERVTWTLSGGNLVQEIWDAIGDPDNTYTNNPAYQTTSYDEGQKIVASGVTEFTLNYYKLGGPVPDKLQETEPGKQDLNAYANMVEVNLTLKQGDVSRNFTRDVYLRVPDRVAEGSSSSIDTVNPPNGQAGHSLTVQITGTNTHFSNGQSTAYFGVGITVTSTTVTDPTHADANIVIAPTAALGDRDVYVNTGGSPGEFPDPLKNGFEVK